MFVYVHTHVCVYVCPVCISANNIHSDTALSVCVQGKGSMTTYWLVGKQGYNKPLPTEDMMASASQHEFK